MQLYFDVELAMWSFNSLVRAWEPVLEPWKLIINGDMNSGQSVSTDAPCPHLAFREMQTLAELLGKCDTSSHLQSVPVPCWKDTTLTLSACRSTSTWRQACT